MITRIFAVLTLALTLAIVGSSSTEKGGPFPDPGCGFDDCGL